MSDFMFATGIENSYPTMLAGRVHVDTQVQADQKKWERAS